MIMMPYGDEAFTSEFHAALRDNGIPPCPEILQRINAEMQKEEPNLRHLADMICRDVGLSAGLLKTANSPFFGTRQRVASVTEALMILGLNKASQAVACVALHQAFPNLRHIERFWDASARIARLSGWLTQEMHWPNVKAEEAYTFGLFRDCGIAVLMQRFPDYEMVLADANRNSERCFTSVEEDVMPTNHAVVGAMLTQSWWLPDAICNAVRYHHDLAVPTPPDDVTVTLVAIAHVAEHLVQEISGLSQTREWQKLGESSLQQLDLTEQHLSDLCLGASKVLAEH